MMCESLFTDKDREDFKPYVKKRFDRELPLHDAIVCGYLDVCRRPLAGIGKQILSPKTPTVVREAYIGERFIPKIDDLINEEVNFDNWHEALCADIKVYYSENGYNSFTVGKAQKWVNMAMKYIVLYNSEYSVKLQKFVQVFHVPIDRYIAHDIACEIRWLPCIGHRVFTNLDDSFDADKRNYSWSKIDDYQEYLSCQADLRKVLSGIPPLRWEYDCWLRAKGLLK